MTPLTALVNKQGQGDLWLDLRHPQEQVGHQSTIFEWEPDRGVGTGVGIKLSTQLGEVRLGPVSTHTHWRIRSAGVVVFSSPRPAERKNLGLTFLPAVSLSLAS